MDNKSKITKEDPEYGVDSRYSSDQERISDGKLLMEARLKRLKDLSPDQARLIQLKLNNRS